MNRAFTPVGTLCLSPLLMFHVFLALCSAIVDTHLCVLFRFFSPCSSLSPAVVLQLSTSAGARHSPVTDQNRFQLPCTALRCTTRHRMIVRPVSSSMCVGAAATSPTLPARFMALIVFTEVLIASRTQTFSTRATGDIFRWSLQHIRKQADGRNEGYGSV